MVKSECIFDFKINYDIIESVSFIYLGIPNHKLGNGLSKS